MPGPFIEIEGIRFPLETVPDFNLAREVIAAAGLLWARVWIEIKGQTYPTRRCILAPKEKP